MAGDAGARPAGGASPGETNEKESRRLQHYHYIVVHRSCAEHVGVLACQVAHAVAESLSPHALSYADLTRVAVLVVETASELIELSDTLTRAGVRHALVREPDPPYFGSATALGVFGTRETVGAHMKGLKVLR